MFSGEKWDPSSQDRSREFSENRMWGWMWWRNTIHSQAATVENQARFFHQAGLTHWRAAQSGDRRSENPCNIEF